MQTVDDSVRALVTDLLKPINKEKVLQKHFLDSKSRFFSETISNEDMEYEFRLDLATACDVNISDVIIIGSAKVGFSVKTDKFVRFDKGVDKNGKPKKSDIDVAIINRDFFDRLTYDIFKFSEHFSARWIREKWTTNRVYDILEFIEEPLFQSYAKYHAKGWLRPDFLPDDFLNQQDFVKVAGRWRSKLSNRKVSVGIYSGWNFFKFYHMDNLEKLSNSLGSGRTL